MRKVYRLCWIILCKHVRFFESKTAGSHKNSLPQPITVFAVLQESEKILGGNEKSDFRVTVRFNKSGHGNELYVKALVL